VLQVAKHGTDFLPDWPTLPPNVPQHYRDRLNHARYFVYVDGVVRDF
jgi:hypothetical protein